MTDKLFENYVKTINAAKKKYGSNFRALRIAHWEKGNHTLCEVTIELHDYPKGLKLRDITAGIISISKEVKNPTECLLKLQEKMK